MKPTFFYAQTDIVVVGHDNEMADYSNPRGEIFGSAAYVVAEDAKGYRVRKYITTKYRDDEALAVAERQAIALNLRLSGGKLPVAFDRWEHYHPAYGSDAYVESGEEQNLIDWEREQEHM